MIPEKPSEMNQAVREFSDTHELVGLPVETAVSRLETDNVVMVVAGNVLLGQVVLNATDAILKNPSMLGVLVHENGRVIGFLSAQAILQYTPKLESFRRYVTGLDGNPLSEPETFVCPDPNHDYSEIVSDFDPDDPPRCPIHGLALERE